MTTKKPSAVSGLRRGVGAVQAEPATPPGNPYLEADQRNARPRSEKPVRFTLDLDRDRHSYLKEYAAQIEANASEVIRELLDEMRADDDLRARIRARIWQRPR